MAQFDWTPDVYLERIRAEIPGYDDLQDQAVAAIPFGPERVLELGMGTGETTRRLIEAHPEYVGLFYNLACCESLAGRTSDAIEHLRRSIEMSERSRAYAKGDSDFDPHRPCVRGGHAETECRAIGDSGRNRDAHRVVEERLAGPEALLARLGPRFTAPTTGRTRTVDRHPERDVKAVVRLPGRQR